MIHAQNGQDKVLISPAALTAGASSTANLDCAGADYATVRALVTLGTTATIASSDGTTVQLLSSDDTNVSNFATVKSFTGIKNSSEVLFQIDTRAQKRYLRLSMQTGTSGVTNEAGTVAAVGTLTRQEQTPHAASGEVTGANDQVYIG
jgi:hypothetical protein